MKLSQLFTGGAMAALAAALAFTAIPAQAQDNDRRGWRTSQSDDRSSARSERRTERTAQRTERRAERPAAQTQRTDRRAQRPAAQQQRAAPQPAAQQRTQRRAEATQQRGNRDTNRTDRRDNRTATRGGWNTGNAPALRPGRNPTYVDPNRNVNSRDRDGRRDNDRNVRDGRRDNDRNWQNGRRDSDRRWDRRWRDNDRYNWSSYRNHNRNIFRPGRYYSPYRNYNYRRLNVGIVLDSLFYSNRYWINDPWQYRLPDVYGSYRWVRYYDDALLVDTYSGQVVDVIHNFFW
jgi:hypothetical protein